MRELYGVMAYSNIPVSTVSKPPTGRVGPLVKGAWAGFETTHNLRKCEVTPMKCPVCKSEKFYVKDPDDEYETYEFQCPDGEICFDPDVDESDAPVVDKDTETYCNKCVWHDTFEKLQKQKG